MTIKKFSDNQRSTSLVQAKNFFLLCILFFLTALSFVFFIYMPAEFSVEEAKGFSFLTIIFLFFVGTIISNFCGVISLPFLYYGAFSLYTGSAPLLYYMFGEPGLLFYRAFYFDYFVEMFFIMNIAPPLFGLGVVFAKIRSGGRAIASAETRRGSHTRADARSPESEEVRQIATISLLCQLLLLFSFAVVFYETMSGRGLSLIMDGNYHAYSGARKLGDQSLIYNLVMQQVIPVAIITYYATEKYSVRDFTIADIWFLVVLILMAMAGDRGGMLAMLAVWVWAYHSFCRRINLTTFVGVGVCVLIFIPSFQVLRTIGWSQIDFQQTLYIFQDLGAADKKFGGSIVQAILGPFSSASMTLMGTVLKVENISGLQYGADYLKNALAAIPFLSNMAANNSNEIHQLLIPGREGGPGFMAIAEMYNNFHVIGVALGHFLIGFYLMSLQDKVARGGMSARAVSFGLICFYGFLIWIRNESSGVLQLVFYWWFFVVLCGFLSKPFLFWRRKSAGMNMDTK